ncbi:MAG TPA: PRC-barrel domain-containing protein [Magnetospirillaceae bacterium]|jgi:sporulation protein YlmC with PRC-barrel domain
MLQSRGALVGHKKIAARRLAIVAAIATSIVAGVAVEGFAQGAPQTVTKVNVVAIASGFRASKIDGSTVVNDHGDTIGTVDDIVMVNDATNAYAILSVGGFLGLGTYLVAVPFKDLQIEKNKITLSGATKDQLRSLPPFQYAKS